MKKIAFVFLLLSSLCLAGCGGHSKDYLKKDKEINPLVVPPGVPLLKQQDYFPIPKGAPASVSAKVVSQKPPTMVKDNNQ